VSDVTPLDDLDAQLGAPKIEEKAAISKEVETQNPEIGVQKDE